MSASGEVERGGLSGRVLDRGLNPPASIVGPPKPRVSRGVGLGPLGMVHGRLTAFSGMRKRLAAYKAPRLIEVIGELPTTVTGKIQRRALRDRAHF